MHEVSRRKGGAAERVGGYRPAPVEKKATVVGRDCNISRGWVEKSIPEPGDE